MNVIPFDSIRARRAQSGAARSGVAFLLAATLAAGTGNALGAEQQVERDESPRSAAETPAEPAAPAEAAKPATRAQADKNRAQSDRDRTSSEKDREEAERDRNARLQDAKRRLEQAAAEVAALSTELAAHALDGIGSAFVAGPRRSIIGVQLEAAESGTGAKVREVSPGGAAEAAGLRAGDVIVAVDGKEVKEGAREVARLLRAVEPDTTVQLRVLRDGKPKEIKVTARPFDARTFAYRAPPDGFDFDFDPSKIPFGPFGPSGMYGGLGGMEVTALTPQLARYFGTDKGLLVVRAPKSDVYKLQDGDVILNIDGRVPTSGSQVARILRSYQAGETLTMRIMRDRKPMDLQITLPDERTRRARAVRTALDTTEL
ncbi:MAG TPA: PDZ domain-containing protein [Steroidobacteraceae bacterium]|jgi:C-terminal processing protease CtpA/Prc|nr:PDZ domain-containing protein [Steroidobacteraceae bacterium]